MSFVPLARYLVDFGSGSDAGKSLADIERVRALVEQESAARVAESHARGFEEGRVFAEEQSRERLEAQQKEQALERERERREWVAKEGEALATALVSGLREMEHRLAAQVARVLEHFVSVQVREQALAELATLLQALVSKSEGARIEVAGPEDLLAIVRRHLAEHDPAATFQAGSGPDIRIQVDETIVETRLGAWAASLAEAMR